MDYRNHEKVFLGAHHVGEYSGHLNETETQRSSLGVPRSTQRIANFYYQNGPVVRITDEVIQAITIAFNNKHDSVLEEQYFEHGMWRKRSYVFPNPRSVKQFLTKYKGQYSILVRM